MIGYVYSLLVRANKLETAVQGTLACLPPPCTITIYFTCICTHTCTAGLSSIAVAETAIRVDRSPPLMATYGDGDDVVTGDVDFQRSTAMLCVHAAGVTDLESGIAEILWEAGIYITMLNSETLRQIPRQAFSGKMRCLSWGLKSCVLD